MNKLEKNAVKLVEILNKAGFVALFAGGYVRDKILKRKINDIDIATNATPKEIKKILDRNKIKHIEIGEKFGVIAAVIDKKLYEIATFREEFGTEDYRRPKKVKFNVTPEEDAKRRDFTINGLFLSQISNLKSKNQILKLKSKDSKFVTKELKRGTIIDYVGGLEDLKKGVVKFIGDPDERIKEDALRMMRAVRFSVQLGFEIEEKSYKAILKNSDLIKEISAERIRDELNKILISVNPRHGLEFLDKSGFLKIIIPELLKGKSTPQPKNEHLEGSVWNHTLLSLEKMRKNDNPIFCWAVLLHDIGKPYTIQTPEKDKVDRIRFSGHDSEGAKIAGGIMKRLKFSNNEIDKAMWLIKFHMVFANLFKMREAKRIRYLKHPYFSDLLELFWVDANSSVRSNKKGKPLPPNLAAYNRAKKILEKEKAKKPLPKPIIRGNDIMKLMGIKSGNKKVGEILEEIYNYQLEKKFKTKGEGLRLAKKLLRKRK